MNMSYSMNPECPKFISNNRVFRKIGFRVFESSDRVSNVVCFEFQLTPEEEELRRLRREKNKLAAQKCRSKKKQRADVLEEVSLSHFIVRDYRPTWADPEGADRGS